MTISQSLKIVRQRCPYCRDDIIPGDDNRACHACLAWHHSECWGEYGGCVSCGNDSTENPDCRPGRACGDPQDCFIHGELNPRARQDLIDLHGRSVSDAMSNMCSCDTEDHTPLRDTYQESLTLRRARQAYQNEIVACGWCDEPVKRSDDYCKLCLDEIHYFREVKAAPGVTSEERRNAIEATRAKLQRSEMIWALLSSTLFVASIIAGLWYYFSHA